MLKPKLITTLKNYTREQFFHDAGAGAIVAIIALPLSIALAIASGLSPEKGLYSAIVGGFLISFLGGSRVLIGGPSGAFVILSGTLLVQHGPGGLALATLMAGVILILMGFLRLGSLIKYIPASITSGFGSGIAVIIFSTQIKDFLGLSLKTVPPAFTDKILALWGSLPTFHWESLVISFLTIAVIILWPRTGSRIPGTLAAIVLGTLAAIVLGLDVPTIGSQFSQLKGTLPLPALPAFSLPLLQELAVPALTIAVLAAMESLLSAVVADGMIGGRHRSNMELIAEGAANLGASFFGGMPVTGAIARTTANVQNGGRTPVAGIIHSLALLLMLLILMPAVKLIPMASMAGILTMVSYNMGDWGAFRHIFKGPKTDAIVLLSTFLLTVFVDLASAIALGMILSALSFMKKMADTTAVSSVSGMEEESIREHLMYPEHVSLYEINGPFFFGAADKFLRTITQRSHEDRVLIIRMSAVPFMDATAYGLFSKLLETSRKKGIKILLLDLQEQPYQLLKKYGFLPFFGEQNILRTREEAIRRANEVLAEQNKASR